VDPIAAFVEYVNVARQAFRVPSYGGYGADTDRNAARVDCSATRVMTGANGWDLASWRAFLEGTPRIFVAAEVVAPETGNGHYRRPARSFPRPGRVT
jgi:hypothetical protein